MIIKTTYQIESKLLHRSVEVDMYVPTLRLENLRMNLLLVNDGQDLAGMNLEHTLSDLYEKRKIEPVVVIGIKAGIERTQEYGVANRPDFKGRGLRAHLYTSFVMEELLPFIHKHVPVTVNGKKAFAGFSLGGLTAFDVAWNNDDFFDVVGVFSGSFWWRKKDLADSYTDADRVLHEMVRESTSKPSLKFWLMAGTEDEIADRNQNFIIDSIDDTIDVIKELLQKNYSRSEDIRYYEMVGGKHDVATWGLAMPKFLEWAFARF